MKVKVAENSNSCYIIFNTTVRYYQLASTAELDEASNKGGVLRVDSGDKRRVSKIYLNIDRFKFTCRYFNEIV